MILMDLQFLKIEKDRYVWFKKRRNKASNVFCGMD